MLTLLGIENAALPDAEKLCAYLPAQWLSAWEARHVDRAHKRDTLTARQSLGGLCLLRALNATGTLCYEKDGKPTLSDTTLDFSITHTDTLVLCALESRTDKITPHVGIDAESILRIKNLPTERLAARWFTADEQTHYQEDATSEAFARIWTRKEALVKYHGRGLSDLRETDTVAAEKSGIRFTEYRIGDVLATLCHNEEIAPTEILFHTI